MNEKPKDIQNQSDAEILFLQKRIEELEKKLLRQNDLEQRVEESEQRFKQMLSLTYDGIILYEKNSGIIIDVNIRLIHKLKYRRDDVIGKSVTQFIIPGQQSNIRNRLTEELPDIYETFIVDSEGQPIEVEICSRSCLYQGRKIKMAAVCDISYRKNYEKTLKDEISRQTEIVARIAEEKYKVLTSLLPEMVFDTDSTTERLTFVNVKAIEVFEYGSDFYINNLRFIELISKDDRRRCTEDFAKFVADGSGALNVEYVAITKTGRKFPVSLHLTKMYVNHVFTGLSILMFDLTANQTAMNYKENLSFLSKSALNFLTLSNDDDIFIFVGKSLSKFASKSIVVVFSYEQSSDISNIRYISGIFSHIDELIEILGKPPEEFNIQLPAKFKGKYLSDKVLKRIDCGLKSFLFEKQLMEKAEQIQKLLKINDYYSMGMVRDGKLYGGLLIAVGSDKDIDTQTIETFIYQAGIALHRKQIDNELVKAKLAAEASDRLKSAFLANMSHEVRTPLNGILGLAQVMLKSGDMPHKFRNDIKMIVESGTSLLALIEDIMDVSKIEAGQMKIKYKPFVLNSMIDQLFSIFKLNPLYLQKNGQQQNIELKCDKLCENITIMSDPDRLQQIFINLIGNALKFTQRGFVHFGYTIEDQEITFYVKDSGIGIPKDKTDQVFERFTQVDNTLARKFKGSGLGLAISKGLITLLNGTIWCESELGKGSCFYFTIPYHPTTMLADDDTPTDQSVKEHDWSEYTALIVEDDTINFKVIEAMLRGTKLNLIRAENGLKAIENVRMNPHIDLVLMDVHLPVMSGLEATGIILEIHPKLPIIAQTANAMSDDKEKCLEAGCIDYISKPIDMGELIRKISKFLPGN